MGDELLLPEAGELMKEDKVGVTVVVKICEVLRWLTGTSE